MTLELWRGSCKVSLLSVLALCNTLISTLDDSAFAQIVPVPDDTLGTKSSVVNSIDALSDRIDGGVKLNGNLFHSFREFNVGENRSVNFANPQGITDIFSRVTGSNPSKIFGELGVLGDANLFLINPNGIIFGENASLNVAGSFFATTEDSFVFENGLQFSAKNTQKDAPLLSVSLTPGLQFGTNPKDITSSADLTVGKDLTLAARNLDLQRGLRSRDGGNINLTAIEDITTADVSSFISGDEIGNGGDITITSLNGSINTTVMTIDPDTRERRSGIVNSSGFGDRETPGKGGDISLTASGDITTAEVGSYIGGDGIGSGGDITITSQNGEINTTAGEINSSSGFGISLEAESNIGKSGDISLTASGNITTANILSYIGNNEIGDAGDITITSQNGNINTTAGRISSTGFGNVSNPSKAGNIKLTAISGNITTAEVSSFIRGNGIGSGGDVTITSEKGEINTTAGEINSSSGFGTSLETESNIGKGGDISLTASGNITTADVGSYIGNNEIGDAGDITIRSQKGEINTTAGRISSSGFGNVSNPSKGGNIELTASGDISTADVNSEIPKGGIGDGGDITIDSQNGEINTTAGRINSSGFGIELTDEFGNELELFTGGNIKLKANGNITTAVVSSSIGNTGIGDDPKDTTPDGAIGKGGDITIESTNGNINTIAGDIVGVNSVGFGTESTPGKGGDIILEASGDITTAYVGSFMKNGGVGNGGDVTIESQNGKFSLEGYEIRSYTSFGEGGNINITAESVLLKDRAALIADAYGNGNAGNVNIDTQSLTITDSSEVLSRIFGTGEAGDVIVKYLNDKASSKVFLNNNAGIFSTVESGANSTNSEEVSKVSINAGSLELENQAQIQTLVREATRRNSDNSLIPAGKGNAGTIEVNVDDSVIVKSGAQLRSDSFGQGNAGNINIRAGVKLDNEGNPIFDDKGNPILIGSLGKVTFDGENTIAFNTLGRIRDPQTPDNVSVGIGQGGTIDIQARSLSVLGGANLSAQTSGEGNAGNILVNTSDFVEISGFASYPTLTLPDGSLSPGGFSSGLFTTSDPKADGQGGEINIKTDTLRLSNGGALSARTQSGFKGGDIKVNANALEITDGAQILTTAFSSGNAGDIDIKVRDNITMSGSDPTFLERKNRVEKAFPNGFGEFITGKDVANFTIDPISSASGIFANTDKDSTGKGGSITIDPELVTIKDGGIIAVNSEGKGEGGNLTLTSNRLILDNGKITAETSTANGGDINLNVDDIIFMRRNSQISATAGDEQFGGNGGNITISSLEGFVVATLLENNDITANAFRGDGGRVQINTKGIFGIEFREQESISSNDITASSRFGRGGEVSINTPDVDPANSITALPADVVDPSNQIDQGCAAFNEETASEFRITGRGGLPPSPDQPLNSNTVWEDTRTTATAPQNLRANTTAKTPTVEPNKITPAAGWVFKENGEVTLVASASKATSEKLGSAPKSCPTR